MEAIKLGWITRWAFALAAVALLFTEHVPALVCFACTAALAMFCCWELEHHAAS
jgi:hypothetical protein